MATLNNNQLYSIINELLTESTGAAPDEIAVKNIIDNGLDSSVIGSVEQFTKKLINIITKNWFLDSSYRSKYTDPFYVDSAEYGALTQAIQCDLVSAEAALNWQNFGTGVGEVSTVGTYSVKLPNFNTKMFGKSVSWQCSITITGTQWNSAFKSGEGVRELVSYILMVLDNSIIVHKENMNRTNRNTMMARNLYAESASVAGTHAVNLVEAFVQERGDSTSNYTVAQFLKNKDALLFATEKLRLYQGYIGEYNSSFNIDGKDTFTPTDRIVVQVLSQFEEILNTNALSSTFHDELVALPGYQSVSFWQGSGSGFAWDDVSKIDIDLDGTNKIAQDGIVAFIADKWSCAHTIVQERTAAKVFEPEDLTNYYKQFTDRYQNITNLNSIVFYLDDYTA